MDQVEVDIQQRKPTGRLAYQMCIPDFFKQRSWRCHGYQISKICTYRPGCDVTSTLPNPQPLIRTLPPRLSDTD